MRNLKFIEILYWRLFTRNSKKTMTDFKIDCSLYYLKSIFEAIEFKNGPFIWFGYYLAN